MVKKQYKPDLFSVFSCNKFASKNIVLFSLNECTEQSREKEFIALIYFDFPLCPLW